jgi:hypothetical protein
MTLGDRLERFPEVPKWCDGLVADLSFENFGDVGNNQ